MLFYHRYDMKVDGGSKHHSTQSQQSQQSQQQAQQQLGSATEDSQAFGVALDRLVDKDGATVARMAPKAVLESISYIRRTGLDTEGLFRRSPPSTALRAAKERYNLGETVDLEQAGGVHVAAVLLKLFFRELPQAVFGGGYSVVRGLPQATEAGQSEDRQAVAEQMASVRVRYVREEIVGSLSKEYRRLLCCTFALLRAVAQREETNKMTAYNLAVVWAPNLARSEDPVEDVAMCAAGPGAATVGAVVQIMVQSFGAVFEAEVSEIAGAAGDADDADDAARRVLDAIDQAN
ncbi:hypothetical protein EV175_006608 [Coemansia sp. RSA 1933]|nr:hypothetical protein EV175_006608 [Coemansia sp. RSA 1933]